MISNPIDQDFLFLHMVMLTETIKHKSELAHNFVKLTALSVIQPLSLVSASDQTAAKAFAMTVGQGTSLALACGRGCLGGEEGEVSLSRRTICCKQAQRTPLDVLPNHSLHCGHSVVSPQ